MIEEKKYNTKGGNENVRRKNQGFRRRRTVGRGTD